jgi:hypothetical protein
MSSPKDLFAVAGRCSCEACQATPQPRSIVLVPQVALDAWIVQLQALPPRKRMRWKGRLVDSNGVASRLRYRAKGNTLLPWCSYFEEYNTHLSQWLPVYPYEALRNEFESFTLAGPFAESTDRIMRQGDIEGLCDLYASRTSGKSRRNRWVAVPTAAGEPTRG